MSGDFILFVVVAALAIASAVIMVTRANPIKSVLFLIVNFFCLAILYLSLQAQFIAIIQILVYAGAIMVLFLFVVMLLNVEDEQSILEKKNYKKLIAFMITGIVFIEIMAGIGASTQGMMQPVANSMAELGTVESIGRILFTEFLFPFEVVSLLLLAAMVGVIVLAKRKFQ